MTSDSVKRIPDCERSDTVTMRKITQVSRRKRFVARMVEIEPKK
jgi:hypothetical protein